MKGTLHFKNKIWDFDIDETTTGNTLIQLAHNKTHIYSSRIRIFYYGADISKKIGVNSDTCIKDIKNTKFYVKDLGPQVGYRLVFILEYLGPLLIFLIVLSLMKTENITSNMYLACAIIMWEGHYAKRLLETIFVHTFSHATMPLKNLFKNCIYYWTAAVFISRSIVKMAESVSVLSTKKKIGIAIFCISEALNFYCHIKLRLLRPKGSTKRFLPKGFLFNHIVCPNYTTEICTWIGFFIFSEVFPAFIFLIAGAIQMLIWAIDKKKKLVSQFPEVKKRALIIPFIL
jgi:very-long-chain enoyl-CoA reductase